MAEPPHPQPRKLQRPRPRLCNKEAAADMHALQPEQQPPPSTTRESPNSTKTFGLHNNLKLIIKGNLCLPRSRPQPPVCRVCLLRTGCVRSKDRGSATAWLVLDLTVCPWHRF